MINKPKKINSFIETGLIENNNLTIIGVDEVGRGPLAGPLIAVAGCFIYDNKTEFNNFISESIINDSKTLSKKIKIQLNASLRKIRPSNNNQKLIVTNKSKVGFIYQKAHISNLVIDKINIHQANLLAIYQATKQLVTKYDYYFKDKQVLVLIDGRFFPKNIKSKNIDVRAIINGDKQSITIAAASIIAKVMRDRYMKSLDIKFPQFSWAKNSGYPTKQHKDAILQFGTTKYHRLSFANLKKIKHKI